MLVVGVTCVATPTRLFETPTPNYDARSLQAKCGAFSSKFIWCWIVFVIFLCVFVLFRVLKCLKGLLKVVEMRCLVWKTRFIVKESNVYFFNFQNEFVKCCWNLSKKLFVFSKTVEMWYSMWKLSVFIYVWNCLFSIIFSKSIWYQRVWF